jgi:hypothetical protein
MIISIESFDTIPRRQKSHQENKTASARTSSPREIIRAKQLS